MTCRNIIELSKEDWNKLKQPEEVEEDDEEEEPEYDTTK